MQYKFTAFSVFSFLSKFSCYFFVYYSQCSSFRHAYTRIYFLFKIPFLSVFSILHFLIRAKSTPYYRRAFVILYDFCCLFDYLQLIFPGSQADLFCLIQSCLPLNIRIGILKVVMMTVPSRLCQMLSKLAVGDRCCLQAGICTGLIQCNRSKLANIPISGRIGASFSPWQSQLGLISCTSAIWK